MKKIILLLILILSLSITCYDARGGCYEENNRVYPGFCELITLPVNGQNANQLSTDELLRLLLICYKQDQDRKICDDRTEYWPLPKNFNRPNRKF